MKIISAIENSLSPQLIQKLSPHQQRLIHIFLERPNEYKSKTVRFSYREHQDGTIERWKIQLDIDFYVYIDGGAPKPWSNSDADSYFMHVILVGYERAEDFYLL